MPKFRLIIGDCSDTDDVGVPDFVITSPPYKARDGYNLNLMESLANKVQRVVKKDALIFINFGQLKEAPTRPFEVVYAFDSVGLSLRQTIIWVKSLIIDGASRGHYQPINSKTLVNYCFEYVFVFERPGYGRRFDRLAVGCPFTDKSNLNRGGRGKHGDIHCGGDAWFIPYKTTGNKNKKNHCYEYPLEIPSRCLRLAGAKPGDLVWDPFCGSGTTALAAKSLGVDFIGHEIDHDVADIARSRWKAWHR